MRISGWFSRMFGLWAEAFKSYKSSESPSSRQQTVAHAVTVETPEMSSLSRTNDARRTYLSGYV